MISFYVEINILPDEDASSHFLWSKLYTQLHLAFVEHKDANDLIPYGVSFPEYKTGQRKNGDTFFYLGSKVRIFARSEQALADLNLAKWLEHLRDYVHIKSVKATPDDVQYATFERARAKASLEQRAQHQAKRRGITLAESLQHFKDYQAQNLDLPYVSLKSESNGSAFNLFIRKVEQNAPVDGKYGTYGLSKQTTVPVW